MSTRITLHLWDRDRKGAEFRIQSDVRHGTGPKFAKRLRSRKHGRYLAAVVMDETPGPLTSWWYIRDCAHLSEFVHTAIANAGKFGRDLEVKLRFVTPETDATVELILEGAKRIAASRVSGRLSVGTEPGGLYRDGGLDG